MEPTKSAATGPHLLILPAELRNHIYRLALVSNTSVALLDSTWQNKTNLLKLNQQVRKEASDIFFAENTFMLAITVCAVKRICKDVRALDSKQAALIPALSVTFKSCGHVHKHIRDNEMKSYNLDLPYMSNDDLWDRYKRVGNDVARALVQVGIKAERISGVEFEGGKEGSCMRGCGSSVIGTLRCYLEEAKGGRDRN